MTVLSVSNVSLSFGTTKILENVSFSINENDKLAIVGVNGAGKSSLLKIILDSIPYDSGKISVASQKKIGFLKQDANFEKETVFEEVLKEFSHLTAFEYKLNELQNDILAGNEKATTEYSRLYETFKKEGGLEYKNRIKSAIEKNGFSPDFPIRNLSGGQKTVVSLIKLILSNPDILILDEPTNHLDINGIVWLESTLKQQKNALIVVSHDRYFLDRVCNKTLEIENGISTFYNCSYTEYRNRKSKDREVQLKHYKTQQSELKRLYAYIEQQRRFNRERNIIAAESRLKLIDKMEKVEAPSALPESVSFTFCEAQDSSNDVLKVTSLSKKYGSSILFRDLSFEIKRGERFFIIGKNGCGKSTLLKILTERVSDFNGSFRFGQNIVSAYYDQEYQTLNPDNLVIDELYTDSTQNLGQIRSLLAVFLFKGEDVFKRVANLSGGEKARLTLAKITQKKVNLLILDEPTNHLDINSKEALENALLKFKHTIICVSHDRYFIEKLATHILELQSPSLDFLGTYEQFLLYKQKYTQENLPTQKSISQKELYLQKKNDEAQKRKAKQFVLKTKLEMEDIENTLASLDELINNEEIQSNYVKLQEVYLEKEKLEKRWEELYILLEEQKENL